MLMKILLETEKLDAYIFLPNTTGDVLQLHLLEKLVSYTLNALDN